MTAATAEAPTRIGWVPVPEHAVNRASRSPTVAPARLGPLLAVCGLAGGAGVTHPVLPDRARRRPAVDRVRCWSPTPAGRAAASPRAPASRSRARSASSPSSSPPGSRSAAASTRPGATDCASSRPDPSSPRAQPTTTLSRLLAHAREAHGLTVIDCGTLTRAAEQTAAAAATHIAWVLTATAHGVRRGRRVLEAAPADGRQGADRRPQRRPPGDARRCAS